LYIIFKNHGERPGCPLYLYHSRSYLAAAIKDAASIPVAPSGKTKIIFKTAAQSRLEKSLSLKS